MRLSAFLLAASLLAGTASVGAQDINFWLTTEGSGIQIRTGSHHHHHTPPPPPPRHHMHHGKKHAKKIHKKYKKYRKAQKKYYKAQRDYYRTLRRAHHYDD